MIKKYFTSEQVSCGHPDKICDQISDYILDKCLEQDKNSRVAIETLIKDDVVVVAGELTTVAKINIEDCVRYVINDIGIDDLTNIKIINLIGKQSLDISQGVDIGGAGDQGIMFGYATRETDEMLPLSYILSTKILKEIRLLNNKKLKTDAKSQVTVAYDENGNISVDTILVSVQHVGGLNSDDVELIVKPIIDKVLLEYNIKNVFSLFINPTGKFVVGGSFGDCGLTGRKIIADTYGGYGRHGGGAFSGKDPSKVDRSGAYMCRYLAKYVLLNNLQYKECEIQISYAIGIAQPTSLCVICDGKENQEISKKLIKDFDLTPKGIVDFLDLKNVKYYETSKYGHFTNKRFNWEV